jgi:predicted O-linked N-acetylglucosamine transferase (SPINDLY family)
MAQIEQPPAAVPLAERALALWQAGRTAEAEALAHAAHLRDPADLLALNILAAASLGHGDAERALGLADRALALAPGDHRAWNSRGVALRRLGRPDEAANAFARAIELAPSDPAAYANFGNLKLAQDDPGAALAAFAAALARHPAAPTAREGRDQARSQLMEEAVRHHNAGDLDRAERLYGSVLAACPDDPEALLFHAKVLRRTGRPEVAERTLGRRLTLASDAPALEELGRLRRAQGRPLEALAAFEAALRQRPDHAPSWHERAAVELAAGQPDAAAASARRAAELAPTDLDIRVTLAAAEQGRGRLEPALSVLEEASRLRRHATVDAWLAATLSLSGQLGRIAARERLAAELHALLDEPAEQQRLARELDPVAGMRVAFLLQFTGGSDERRWRFLRLLAGRIDPQPRPRPRLPPPRPGERLRLGYLSPNFGEHPTGHLLAPILESHDRDRFELFLYSTMDRSRDPPPYPARLRAAADHWRELSGRDDPAVAAAIAEDRLHLVVDLGGYLAGGRPGALALRPAPVQLHWIMHLSGMPAPFLDASLVDGTMVPEDHPERLHGPLARLPDAFQPGYRQEIGAPPGRAESGLPTHGPVLCAFNNPLKIDALALDAWCAILRAEPHARLWLSAGPGDQQLAALRAAAAERGVDGDRLHFAPRLADRARHLARHRLAALYLDTFAFGGATSAMDALLAGLPVLTFRGAQAYGRIGASFNTVLGLPELIAGDPAAYVATALALLRSPDRLAGLRARLERAVATGPLFDAARFTRALEALYLAAIEAVARGQRPP